MLASFVHLHFGSRPGLAAELVERCAAVNVFGVRAAAAAAAEAAGPRGFPADAPRAGGHRGYSSAHVSPEGGAHFSGTPRPIFPVRSLPPAALCSLDVTKNSLSQQLSYVCCLSDMPLTLPDYTGRCRSARRAPLFYREMCKPIVAHAML